MPKLGFIILISLAPLATTAHDSQVREREREILKNRVTCLVSNQRFIVDYLKCQENCKRLQKKNEHYRCSCELWENALNFCG